MAKVITKKPAPPKDDVEFTYDVEQRSDDWFDLRKGIVTASKLATVIASGKDGGDSEGRAKYMKMLAGEIVTGQVAESFRSEAMDRGNRMEPEAFAWYERSRFADLTRIGFVRRTIINPIGVKFSVGASPDAQVGDTGKGVEFKSMAPHLLIDVVKRGAAGFPTGHRAQLQGTMWVCGWDEMDLVLYYTGWPNPPTFTLQRDEAYIRMLAEQVETFSYELEKMVKSVRPNK